MSRADTSALVAALSAATTLGDRVLADPLSWMEWTPPQFAWLRMPDRRKLMRTGNQFGKTTAAMTEVIYRAMGTHPYYPTRRPPVEIWVVCTSYSQSVSIMKKFWELVPNDAIRVGYAVRPAGGVRQGEPYGGVPERLRGSVPHHEPGA